ncbi:type II toxin-antitoxin system Phd/YefM family antitoxin [[Micrococcus luteus] ATCC 49442]|uniref:type II toxin-antitoxin system Phd/YefM family antitoxin n=1 Tax=[Micrococcus luteus] ATCC 49442 TaxID=2698727 RepID=UPI0013D9ED60|nr:type II toxin-antitoxin system Phd/YefM family antitoxin [[Micrococcus luteus] ATCC 49442]
MATITMRDLVRESKRVFDALETDRTPIVVTRNGRPFAALMPLDQDQAEALLLASNPEVAEMQREAERVIASGRAKPLSDALKEQSELQTRGTPEVANLRDIEVSQDASVGAGSDVSESIAKTTEYITEKAIKFVVRAGADSPPDGQWAERIRKLNSTLVEVSYLNELKRVESQKDLAVSAGRKSARRKKADKPIFASKLVALESAGKIVYNLNSEVLLNAKKTAPDDIEETFESELRGGVLFAKFTGLSPVEVLPLSEGRHGRGLLKRR